MEYKYTGIILSKKDIGETDRIYNIYTLEQGRISAIARGVRKPKAKLAGHLENFYLVDLTVMKNRGMGNISSSIVENNFESIKGDFDSLVKVFDASRTMSRLINDQERDSGVFFLFLEYLEVLNKISNSENCSIVTKNLVTQGFIFKLLDILGYKLEFGRCVKCEKKLSREKNFFDYSRGGIVCRQCSGGINSIFPISENSIKIIRIFFKNRLDNLIKLKINHRESVELKQISEIFIKWIC